MSQTVSMMGSNGHNGRNIQQSEHLTRIIPVEVPAHVLEDDPGGVHVAVRVHRLGVAGVSAVRRIVPGDKNLFSTSTSTLLRSPLNVKIGQRYRSDIFTSRKCKTVKYLCRLMHRIAR